MSVNITKICDGVDGLFIRNSRFNTTNISFNFYLPLNKDTVAENALLPFVMTTCSSKYPDFSKLNFKLSKLYGAELSATAEKTGDYQLLKIAISVIDDRFTLDGEELTEQACQLLTSLVFEPKTENGEFFAEDIEREKRKAIEHIRSEISQKRTYAKGRMIEEMYKGKPFGLPKCGTEEQVNAITGKSLFTAWQNMLKSAYVRINVISRSMPQKLFEGIEESFSKISRENITDTSVVSPTRKATSVHEVTERMDIAQGKLVLGMSSKIHGNDEKTVSLLVMTDIFGGGPYSRLFANVREAMSLCYYCTATSIRGKGLITVESGVEADNCEKALKEILNQLEIMKKGEFSDFELEASKKSIIDSMRSYNDSQAALDTWYSVKICDGVPISPEEVTELISKVTRAAVIKAANGVFLHTVYRLLPNTKED